MFASNSKKHKEIFKLTEILKTINTNVNLDPEERRRLVLGNVTAVQKLLQKK